MRRIPTIAFLVACTVGAARAQTYHACLEYNSNYYDLTSTPSGTTLDRYQGDSLVNSQTVRGVPPASGAGTIMPGTKASHFAAAMQTRNSWLNSEQTSKATWVHSANSDSWMWYTTVKGVPNQFEFTAAKCRSATTAAAPTTAGPHQRHRTVSHGAARAARRARRTRTAAAPVRSNPQCIPKDSGVQCCTHFKGAAPCDASQTCCGKYGAGREQRTRSAAMKTRRAARRQSTTQGATCCPTGTTCCAGASVGLCCAADEVCQANMNSCAKASTAAPTPVPAGAMNRGCISYNGWFYDLRSDDSRHDAGPVPGQRHS
jgi:hypothetical protein